MATGTRDKKPARSKITTRKNPKVAVTRPKNKKNNKTSDNPADRATYT